jgi:hypothetical protein
MPVTNTGMAEKGAVPRPICDSSVIEWGASTLSLLIQRFSSLTALIT